MTSLLKRMFIALFSTLPSRLTALSVLMYHLVSDSGAFFAVPKEVFEKQMRFISDSSIATFFASEAAQHRGMRGACITFDDGYKDVYENAFPILKKYGIKASIFLITSKIGGSYTGSDGRTLELLSEKEIKEMMQSGLVEFLPHGHTHRKLHGLSASEQENEVVLSRDAVYTLTGNEPRVFAYPRGRTNAEIRMLLEKLGFKLAFGVSPGLLESGCDMFNAPRNAIDSKVSFAEFRIKLSDRVRAYAAFTRAVRRFI